MASTLSKFPSGPAGEGRYFIARLAKRLHLPRLNRGVDDPVCLSALDETTLGRFGYNEAQINRMKETAFR